MYKGDTVMCTSLIDFISLSENEKLMVLNWRNNDNVRKWMFKPDVISKEDHILFIDSLKTNETNCYHLVLYEDDYIGVIYFTNIDINNKTAEIGIYSDPVLKGMGSILMNFVCDYSFNVLNLHKVIAEVFVENYRAIKLYHNFNFQIVGGSTINNKKVIFMELDNENR